MDAFEKELSNKISSVTPNEINIISAPDLINNKIDLPNNGVITKLKTLDRRELFHYKKNETINVTCLNCETATGTKEIKVQFKKSDKTIWVSANVMYKTKILITTQTIDVMDPHLNKSSVTTVSRFVKDPERYFTDITKIHFYKLGGTVPVGTPIKRRRLIPIPLVTPSIASKVLFRSSNLRLEGTAMPMRSGKFNEMISLRHKKSKRTIYGRVTGPNEVTVEL